MKLSKDRLYEIIFEADTREGKIFDLCLISLIFISILLVIFDSVPSFHDKYYRQFRISEWVITIIFSIEYITRIYIVKKPLNTFSAFMAL